MTTLEFFKKIIVSLSCIYISLAMTNHISQAFGVLFGEGPVTDIGILGVSTLVVGGLIGLYGFGIFFETFAKRLKTIGLSNFYAYLPLALLLPSVILQLIPMTASDRQVVGNLEPYLWLFWIIEGIIILLATFGPAIAKIDDIS